MNKSIFYAKNRQVLESLQYLLIICAFTIGVLCGCVTNRFEVSSTDYQGILSFIQDGNTTRAEILQRLGEPSKTYLPEHKVLVYFLYQKAVHPEQRSNELSRGSTPEDSEAIVATEPGDDSAKYHLVVSFDETDVLKRHSLIRVR